jgi:hypothetical protein
MADLDEVDPGDILHIVLVDPYVVTLADSSVDVVSSGQMLEHCVFWLTFAPFLTRRHWRDLGGYNPAFRSASGGLDNLDAWARAGNDPEGQIVLLLGEATFHQVHGGVATNSTVPGWAAFHEECVAIRGHDNVRPSGSPLVLGRITNDKVHAEGKFR